MLASVGWKMGREHVGILFILTSYILAVISSYSNDWLKASSGGVLSRIAVNINTAIHLSNGTYMGVL